jgi:hypothetical protein
MLEVGLLAFLEQGTAEVRHFFAFCLRTVVRKSLCFATFCA